MFITTCVWCPDSNFAHFATLQLNTYFSLDINGFITKLVADHRAGELQKKQKGFWKLLKGKKTFLQGWNYYKKKLVYY